jgi:hypothetical protein
MAYRTRKDAKERLRRAVHVPDGACACDVATDRGDQCDAGDLDVETMTAVMKLRLDGRRDEARNLERRAVAALNASRRTAAQKEDTVSSRRLDSIARELLDGPVGHQLSAADRSAMIAAVRADGYAGPSDGWSAASDTYVASYYSTWSQHADQRHRTETRADATHRELERVIAAGLEDERLAIIAAQKRNAVEFEVARGANRADAERRFDEAEAVRQERAAAQRATNARRLIERERGDDTLTDEQCATSIREKRIDAEYRAFRDRDDTIAARAEVAGQKVSR